VDDFQGIYQFDRIEKFSSIAYLIDIKVSLLAVWLQEKVHMCSCNIYVLKCVSRVCICCVNDQCAFDMSKAFDKMNC